MDSNVKKDLFKDITQQQAMDDTNSVIQNFGENLTSTPKEEEGVSNSNAGERHDDFSHFGTEIRKTDDDPLIETGNEMETSGKTEDSDSQSLLDFISNESVPISVEGAKDDEQTDKKEINFMDETTDTKEEDERLRSRKEKEEKKDVLSEPSIENNFFSSPFDQGIIRADDYAQMETEEKTDESQSMFSGGMEDDSKLWDLLGTTTNENLENVEQTDKEINSSEELLENLKYETTATKEEDSVWKQEKDEKKEVLSEPSMENNFSSSPFDQGIIMADDSSLMETGNKTDESQSMISGGMKDEELESKLWDLLGTTTNENLQDDEQTDKNEINLLSQEPLENLKYETTASKKEDPKWMQEKELDYEATAIKEEEDPIWMQEKEKCLKASIDERRKKTKCTELFSIETWPEYYNRKINKGFTEAEAELPKISKKVSIWRGDITSLLIDTIVNAANERLLGGGGVDKAIHAAAGPLLKEECYTFGGASAGESVISGGYNLPAKYVIHAVGPRGEKPDILRDCYLGSLKHLIDQNQRSIAFPCISTGIFGYPNDKAAEVVLKTVREWLEKNHEKVDRVIFCLFLEKDVHFYEEKLQKYFPMKGDPIDIRHGSIEAPEILSEVKDDKKSPTSTDEAEEPSNTYKIYSKPPVTQRSWKDEYPSKEEKIIDEQPLPPIKNMGMKDNVAVKSLSDTVENEQKDEQVHRAIVIERHNNDNEFGGENESLIKPDEQVHRAIVIERHNNDNEFGGENEPLIRPESPNSNWFTNCCRIFRC